MNPAWTGCPTCGVEIGVECATSTGRPHAARVRKVAKSPDETLPWRLQ